MSKVVKHKVFVYGTLRPSNKEYEYLPATHVLEGHAMYSAGSYPYIKPVGEANVSCVLGNLIEATKKELAQLDNYEGVDRGLYVRNVVTVLSIADSEPVTVFVYVAGPLLEPEPITSGDWKQYTEQRMSR